MAVLVFFSMTGFSHILPFKGEDTLCARERALEWLEENEYELSIISATGNWYQGAAYDAQLQLL